ncbi:neuronal membrane glycoprotein M6-a-like [Watersipora subatra]|uniref:neuronal membrane glycoprotein M6-a-like n=1 Tax=Watersipora subatra TaxID=2589382 RepID=UPI00355C5831
MGLDQLEFFLRQSDGFNLNEANDILWLGELRVVLTTIGALTGCIGIVLLIFGALATGATRRNVFSGAKCIMGGRCSAAFCLVVTYVVNFAWMLITSGISIPIIFFVMMRSICEMEFRYKGTQPGGSGVALHCFNLSRIGIYYPGYNKEFPDLFIYGPHLCRQSQLTDMCDLVAREIPLMSAAFAGSFLIVISMVSFLMIVSANYQRIKTSKELSDYRDALEQDNTEMDNIITSRRQFNSSYATESVLT